MSTVTFSDMEAFVLGEAARIEQTQAALIRVGDRTTPHPGQLRNKEICEAIHRLVLLCRTKAVSEVLKRVTQVSA
jgi:hypothetical protein